VDTTDCAGRDKAHSYVKSPGEYSDACNRRAVLRSRLRQLAPDYAGPGLPDEGGFEASAYLSLELDCSRQRARSAARSVAGFTSTAIIVADLLTAAARGGPFPPGFGRRGAFSEAFALWKAWWQQYPDAMAQVGGEASIRSCWEQRLRQDRTEDARCFKFAYSEGPTAEQDSDWTALLKHSAEFWAPVLAGDRKLVPEDAFFAGTPKGKWGDPAYHKQLSAYLSAHAIKEEAGSLPKALEPFQSDIVDWLDDEPENEPCVIDRYLPSGYLTGFVGDMGTGKSNIELRAAVCIASGKPFFGMPVKQGRVIGMFAEDSKNQLNSRLRAICAEMDVDIASIADRLRIKSYIGEDVTLWNEKATRTVAAGPTAVARALERAIASTPDIRCVILDSDVDVYNGSELDRNARSRYFGWLAGLARRYGVAIITTFHEAKSAGEKNTHSISGSTAAGYKVKSAWRLEFDKRDPRKRVFTHWKHSFTEQAPTVSLGWSNRTWVALGALDREDGCQRAALALIRQACDAGVNLSTEKRAATYAPRWCHASQESDYTEAEFEQALDHLVSINWVETESYAGAKGKLRKRYTLSSFGLTDVGSDLDPFGPDPDLI
jgi:hypothetical protein